jgi:hypothetical protein
MEGNISPDLFKILIEAYFSLKSAETVFDFSYNVSNNFWNKNQIIF